MRLRTEKVSKPNEPAFFHVYFDGAVGATTRIECPLLATIRKDDGGLSGYIVSFVPEALVAAARRNNGDTTYSRTGYAVYVRTLVEAKKFIGEAIVAALVGKED